MKLYHISLNEYKHYAVGGNLFLSEDDARRFIVYEIESTFGKDFIDVRDKTLDELSDEYNENDCKYGIIVSVYDVPVLKEDNCVH